MIKKILIVLIFSGLSFVQSFVEDGCRLWLRFDKIEDVALKEANKQKLRFVCVEGESLVLETAA